MENLECIRATPLRFTLQPITFTDNISNKNEIARSPPKVNHYSLDTFRESFQIIPLPGSASYDTSFIREAVVKSLYLITGGAEGLYNTHAAKDERTIWLNIITDYMRDDYIHLLKTPHDIDKVKGFVYRYSVMDLANIMSSLFTPASDEGYLRGVNWCTNCSSSNLRNGGCHYTGICRNYHNDPRYLEFQTIDHRTYRVVVQGYILMRTWMALGLEVPNYWLRIYFIACRKVVGDLPLPLLSDELQCDLEEQAIAFETEVSSITGNNIIR